VLQKEARQSRLTAHPETKKPIKKTSNMIFINLPSFQLSEMFKKGRLLPFLYSSLRQLFLNEY